MKATIDINGKAVEIELTPEQVSSIRKNSEKITDRVKTYEDACNILGIKPANALPAFSSSHMVSTHERSVAASCKLIIIAEVLNEGWKPDWNDHNQAKYYPWFKSVGSGSGFAFYDCDCDYAYSDVGSRLCFKSRELAEYAGKQFESIYNDYLTF